MLKLLLAFAIAFAPLLSNAVSIESLGNCNASVKGSVYSILDGDRNTLGGWSHIQTPTSNGEYDGLMLSDEHYQIGLSKHSPDESCNNIKTQNAILVIKLSDWTRQHSNGFETILEQPGLAFDDVTHVLMDIKVNTKNTKLATRAELKQRYGHLIDDDQLAIFDNGKVNLGITLFEEGALDQSSESFNAQLFIEIDQAKYADQWLRIVMPMNEFHTFLEKDFNGESVSMSEYKHTMLHGFRIDPENSEGNQLRNLLGKEWNEGIVETFKEMSVSIRRIELLNMGVAE